MVSVRKFVRCIICLLFVFATGICLAAQLNPPDQIAYSGSLYKLAFQKTLSNGDKVYEYTSNEESTENWTTLVTLTYTEGVLTDIPNWAKTQQEALDKLTPRPFYNFFSDGKSGVATVIFKPADVQATFEAGIIKSFHEDKCRGLVLYQFSRRYQKSMMIASPDYQAIAKDILEIVKETKKVGWEPSCS